jgi:hypothetical protein
MQSARYFFCLILTELGFSGNILIKVSDISLHESVSCRSTADTPTCEEREGRTDGHGEINRHVLTTYLNAPKNLLFFAVLFATCETSQSSCKCLYHKKFKTQVFVWVVNITVTSLVFGSE